MTISHFVTKISNNTSAIIVIFAVLLIGQEKLQSNLCCFFALNRCNFVRSQYNEERQIGIEFLGNTCAIYKDQFSDQRMFM